MMILTIQERDSIMTQLSEAQRDFLQHQLMRSRRTAFANAMAKEKGFLIPDDADPEDIEALLNEWIYTGYIDAGHVSPDLRCECGRALRYQHQVLHKTSGKIKYFGIEHLKEHLGIDASIVNAIMKGFDGIDYELDELLIKIQNGWEPNPDIFRDTVMSPEIAEYLKLGLPLLERQIKQLQRSRTFSRIQVLTKSGQQADFADSQDLFSLDPDPEDLPAPTTLNYALQLAIQEYIRRGIGSARIICELLIREHGAIAARYSTGKPKIFVPVCWYIEESYPDMNIVSSLSDRQYRPAKSEVKRIMT
jgi:hypothetical protein